MGGYRTQICIVEKLSGVSMHQELGMSSYRPRQQIEDWPGPPVTGERVSAAVQTEVAEKLKNIRSRFLV